MNVAWMVAYSVLAVAVVLTLILLLGFMRRVSAVLEATEHAITNTTFDLDDGLPLMAHVPPFSLATREGEPVSSADLLEETAIILFVDAGCGACRGLVPALELVGDHVDELPLIVIAPKEDRPALRVPPNVRLYLQEHRAASEAFRTTVTPRAFVVHPIGAVLERLAPRSIDDLRQLALHQRERVNGSRQGEAAVQM